MQEGKCQKAVRKKSNVEVAESLLFPDSALNISPNIEFGVFWYSKDLGLQDSILNQSIWAEAKPQAQQEGFQPKKISRRHPGHSILNIGLFRAYREDSILLDCLHSEYIISQGQAYKGIK